MKIRAISGSLKRAPLPLLPVFLCLILLISSAGVNLQALAAPPELSGVTVTEVAESGANLHILHNWGPDTVKSSIAINIYDKDKKLLQGCPLTLTPPIDGTYVYIDATGYYTVVPTAPDGYASDSVTVYVDREEIGHHTIGSPGVLPVWEPPSGILPFGSASNVGVIVFGDMSRTGGYWQHSEGGFWIKGNLTHSGMLQIGNVPPGYPAGFQSNMLHPRLLVGGNITSSFVPASDDFTAQNGAIQLNYGSLAVSATSSINPGADGIYQMIDPNVTGYENRVYYNFYGGTSLYTPTGAIFYDTVSVFAKLGVDAVFDAAYADLKALNAFYLGGGAAPGYVGNVYRYLGGYEFFGNDLTISPHEDISGYDTVIFDITPPAGTIENVSINFPGNFNGKYVFNILGSGTVTFDPVDPYEYVVGIGPLTGPITINGMTGIAETSTHPSTTGRVEYSYAKLGREFTNRIVWNFPSTVNDVKTLGHSVGAIKDLNPYTPHGYNMIGTILAPDSNFKPCEGSVNGEVICRDLEITSLYGSWEQHTTDSVGYGNVSRAVVSTHLISTGSETIRLMKRISGGGVLKPSDIFTFTIEELSGNFPSGNKLLGGFTASRTTSADTLNADKEQTLSVIIPELGLSRDYWFRVMEESSSPIAYWVYSKEIYVAKVSVDGTGAAEVVYYDKNGDALDPGVIPIFANRYQPPVTEPPVEEPPTDPPTDPPYTPPTDPPKDEELPEDPSADPPEELPANPPPPQRPGGRDRDVPPAPTSPGNTIQYIDEGHYLELNEDGVPLGEWHWDDEEEMWIFDEDIPLGALPRTGYSGVQAPALILFGLSLCGAVIAMRSAIRKRGRHTKSF